MEVVCTLGAGTAHTVGARVGVGVGALHTLGSSWAKDIGVVAVVVVVVGAVVAGSICWRSVLMLLIAASGHWHPCWSSP